MFVNRLSPILLSTLLTYSVASQAAAPFPRGCEASGYGYNGQYLVLNEHGSQLFYLIKNKFNRLVELQRIETRGAFMSPPLTAKIDSNNWAAFASDIENLHFQCFYADGDKNNQIDCRDALEICQYPRVKFALSNMGNYWVSINKTQLQVITEASAKGIYLRW